MNQKQIYRKLLDGIYAARLHKAAAPITSGVGVIFTLHQVNDEKVDDFSPNAILKVTPQFLEETIKTVLAQGYDIITLDEMQTRLNSTEQSRPFVVFTFDDGYKDNRDIALPIFQKYNIPMTIYIVSDYSSHKGELWWLALEAIIKENDKITSPCNDGEVLEAGTTEEKFRAFDAIYWSLRHFDQHEQRSLIRKMAKGHDFDIDALTQDLIMNWEELRDLAKDPHVHLAAHTKSHFALAKLPPEEARDEVVTSMDIMEKELGQRPVHFSYPYGDARSASKRDFDLLEELGLKTAVTTRKGVLFKGHAKYQTALPRVSLNGQFQKQRYVETFMSGLPFWLSNGLKRYNVT